MKTIVALALMAFSAGAAAQINKCLDASGKVVGYGNECPPGTRTEASGVKVSPPPASAKPAAGADAAAKSDKGDKAPPESAADAKKREAAKKEVDAKKAAAAEQNKRACDESRGYLKSLEGRNRISKRDPKTGEQTFLQDNEYAGEIARTQQTIKANCS
jgi:hypothetical protein